MNCQWITSLLALMLMLISSTGVAPEFWFDLDKPPQERYAALFPQYTDLVHQYAQQFLSASKITESDLQLFDFIAEHTTDRDLIDESRYFSNVTGVPFNVIIGFQYMYEFTFNEMVELGCTSIIVNPPNGKPYLSRNLDWGYQQLISQLTIIAHYYRGNPSNNVITQVGIVGQLSIAHTIKSSYVSMSLDALQQNYTKQQLINYLYQNPSVPAAPRLLRTILEDQSNFSQVREKLLSSPINALRTGFFITVGSEENEGATFHVQDWFEEDNLRHNYKRENALQEGQRYIVTTNGLNNQFSQIRQEQAEFRMSQLSDHQLNNPNEVFRNVQSQYPNRNPRTIFTAALIPESDHIDVYLYY